MDPSTELKREIGLFSASTLVVANMIGTGIFTTSGFVLQEVGSNALLLLGWLVGGGFALCGALCYGELGARYSKAGGEYVYLREAFGKPVAFLSGWVSLIVGFSAPIAAGAIAFSTYLLNSFGVTGNDPFTLVLGGVPIITFSMTVLTAVAVVILLSVLHARSLRMGSRVQNLMTLFKVALMIVFIGAGFAFSGGSAAHFSGGLSLGPMLNGKFAVSLIFISFAYSGWNAAAYLGGEVRKPDRNIPLSLLLGTSLVILLYLLMNLVYVYALPPDQMRGVMEVGAAAANRLFGPQIGRWLSAAIAMGLVSVLSAMILTGPRVYYAMARDGVFFTEFGKVNALRRTPARAVWLQSFVATVMIISSAYDALLVYIGFTLSLFAMLTVAGLMRLRSRKGYKPATYATWGYPATPLIFILGNLWIIYFSLKNRPEPALWGLVTIGSGICVYLCFHRIKHNQKTNK